MLIFIITLGAVAILAVILLIVLHIVFRLAFAPTRKVDVTRSVPDTDQYLPVKQRMLFLVDELDKKNYESVYIKSHDGLRLFARYYRQTDESIIELEFHGYRSSAVRDYCGGNGISTQRGISTLLIDQRSHGKSDGNVITFGIKERYDVLSWVNYTVDRFGKDVKIILSGISMGAATVLMASELDLPKNVVAIIADCPYSSPKEIILKVAKGMGFAPKLIYPFIRLSAKVLGKFNLETASPIEAVRNTDIPIMIIHGDDDRFVPYDMGKRIFQACSSTVKRFESFEGAGHGLCYFKDTERYENAVSDFINPLIK